MFAGSILASILLISPLSAQERPGGVHAKSTSQLAEAIRSGDVAAMQEADSRRDEALTAPLEWAAENFKVSVAARFHGPSGQELITPLERRIRNDAKIVLARWGEKRYFVELTAEASDPDIEIEYQAMDNLARVGNMAALATLFGQIDNAAIKRKTGDVRWKPVGVVAAGAIGRIVRQNTGMPEPRYGIDWKDESGFRTYWKNWWKINRSKYEEIPFEPGRIDVKTSDAGAPRIGRPVR